MLVIFGLPVDVCNDITRHRKCLFSPLSNVTVSASSPSCCASLRAAAWWARRNAVLLKITELNDSHWRRACVALDWKNPSVAMSSVSANSISWSLCFLGSSFNSYGFLHAHVTMGGNWRHFIMIERIQPKAIPPENPRQRTLEFHTQQLSI